MSTATTLATLGLVIEATQALAELGISMADLVNRQNQAELEGREFGIEDLDAMHAEAQQALTDLENS